MLINGKGLLLYYNVAIYILVQSEEEYSLTWKAKPIIIQTGKGNGKKIDQKGKKMTKQWTIVT